MLIDQGSTVVPFASIRLLSAVVGAAAAAVGLADVGATMLLVVAEEDTVEAEADMVRSARTLKTHLLIYIGGGGGGYDRQGGGGGSEFEPVHRITTYITDMIL